MSGIGRLLKREFVFFTAAAMAAASAFIVPPGRAYLGYIDLKVIVSGFTQIGLISFLSGRMLAAFKTERALVFMLTMLCFFSSMLITNDVALLAFVPLTLAVMRSSSEKSRILAVVAQSAAANLGSMATPVGNPQNLYLFSHYSMALPDFFGAVLPYAAAGLVMVTALIFIPGGFKQTPVSCPFEKTQGQKPHPALCTLYLALFVLCVLSVLNLVSCYLSLAAVTAVFALTNVKVLMKIDYFLLLTFVCFFIFVGNLSALLPLRSLITGALTGRELLVSALFSQVISNVPAAVMLSGFTDRAFALLSGTNIGGLGTPVASLASLISYKIYSRSQGARKGAFMLVFLAVNAVMLALMLALSFLI